MIARGPIDPEGIFDGDWRPSEHVCPQCHEKALRYRIWVEPVSGSYRDARYQCFACGEAWWLESLEA